VFVLSSLREGLPNVVLESMALEVPTVATRIAGVPNLIEEDGQHGLLVEPGDASALAKAVDRLLVSEPLRRQMASAARQRVEQRFSFAARMERIRRLYDHLLGRVSVPVEAVR
jgi:glycosyltransferase involved in cell wall biosynthesis